MPSGATVLIRVAIAEIGTGKQCKGKNRSSLNGIVDGSQESQHCW